MTLPRLYWLAAFLFLLDLTGARAEDINPPFKLTWGESGAHIDRLLKGAKATVVERKIVEGREVWYVEGLLLTGLRRTLFYFHKDELVEVELQYQKDDWDEAKYDAYMEQVRRQLEQRYGHGQLIARRKEKLPEDVSQSIVGWKWSQTNTAIELVYFCATNDSNPKEIYRTLSVHYKTF